MKTIKITRFFALFLFIILLLIIGKVFAAVDPIAWSILNPFPSTVIVGEQYEQVYQLKSNLPATMPAPLTVTYSAGSDFTFNDLCTGKFLRPQETCNITILFSPSIAGVQHLQLVLHYFNDVVPLPVQTFTASGSLNLITGTVTQGLPATALVGESYLVIFTFQNVGTSPATDLVLQPTYPTGFTQELNTCSGTLAPSTSCTVQGSLIPPNPGTYTIAASLFYAESQTPASASTSMQAVEVNLKGTVTTNLPSLTQVGEEYPVEFTYTNNSLLPATGVTLTTNYPSDFIENVNTCGVILAASASCNIAGTFTPASAGNFTVGVSLEYVEGSSVPLSTNTTADISGLGVTGTVTIPLPAETAVSGSYPVEFTYINNSSLPATEVTITTNYPAGFTQQSDSCSGTTLITGASCKVAGTITPATVGNYTVGVSLSYAESLSPVPLFSGTSAIVVSITGAVTTPLPATTAPDTSYPVIFSYTNNTSVTATGVVLTPNYPAEFAENANTCSTGTLAAHTTCTIEGSFTPSSPGDYTVATSLSYTGGTASVPLSTSTTTITFALTGSVTTSLPSTTELGQEYPVEFTFTNESPFPATNLNLIPNYPEDFQETSNTCTTTLVGNTSCVVSGIFIPSNTTTPDQLIEVGLSLTYTEGAPIVLTTSTEIANQVFLTGEIIDSLPPIATASATPKPVTFQFTNTGNVSVTGLILASDYPAEFTETLNTCTGIIAVNANCQVSGNLNISTPGSYSVSVTLSTNEVLPVKMMTETLIITAEVLGSVEKGLPSNTAIGTGYLVSFLFTNEGEIDATGVNLLRNYPSDFSETSTTCGTTLAPGASCRVEGTLTPTVIGNQTVELTFQYDEGSDIALSTSTTVGTVVLQGIVQQGFPDVATVGIIYPLTFKYTNPNAVDATGLSIINPIPAGLSIISDTCSGTTLSSGSSCTVEASFTPTQIGTYTAGVTLSYTEGNNITLTTSTSTGNSLIIAVGNGGFFRTTPTWTTWTNRDISSAINLRSIAFSPKLQLYVAAGINTSAGNGTIRITQNGTVITNIAFTPQFFPNSIIWNPDLSQFLVVGAGGGIATSDDGLTWSIQTSNVSTTLNDATWSPQLQQYVVVGENGTILTSPNGIVWQSQTSGFLNNLTGVTWSPELGNYVVSTTSIFVLNSSDGITWTNPGANILRATFAATWSPPLSRYILVGNNNLIVASNNGQQWQTQLQATAARNINDVIWFNRQGRFYAVATSSWVYFSTTGLGEWREKPLNFVGTTSINGITAGAVVP